MRFFESSCIYQFFSFRFFIFKIELFERIKRFFHFDFLITTLLTVSSSVKAHRSVKAVLKHIAAKEIEGLNLLFVTKIFQNLRCFFFSDFKNCGRGILKINHE